MVSRLVLAVIVTSYVFNGLFAQRLGYYPSGYGSSDAGIYCTSQQYRCNNGKCVSGEALCDGRIDCIDGSDETREACSGPNNPPCNPRTFRCDYGACVDGDALCNNVKDCADGSDESPARCSNTYPSIGTVTDNYACGVSQFRCDNGQCIDSTNMCDGRIDCRDSSDETAVTCDSFVCPRYVFRCSYGACIDNDLKCNGVPNCADGSDEDRNICGGRPPSRPPNGSSSRPTTTETSIQWPTWSSTTTVRPQRPRPPSTTRSPLSSCSQPEQPEHSLWTLENCRASYDCGNLKRIKEFVPGTALIYSCRQGYKISGSPNVFCKNTGEWSAIPTCEEIRCPALTDASRRGDCRYKAGYISCDSPVPPGTTGTVECNQPNYEPDVNDLRRSKTVKCTGDGEWEPQPLRCISVCGLSTLGTEDQATALIVNGKPASPNEFPWQATLFYEEPNGRKRFICGGTIIMNNLVITAAHCVFKEEVREFLPPSKFRVMVGNVFQAYDFPNHNEKIVQKFRVTRIFHPCTYLGVEGNYQSDIAILQLNQAITFTASVMRVCLDLEKQTETFALEVGNIGRISGFGITSAGSTSAVLQSLAVPYISQNLCREKNSESSNLKFINTQKFCAGYANGSSACKGDSGGGLVFKTDGYWYLRGIVSVGLGSVIVGAERSCDSYAYTLYEKVSEHATWIKEVMSKVARNDHGSDNC